MRRLLHSGWIFLVALLAIALVAFYYIGWTEAGLKTLADRLSRRIGPVTLQLQGARGSLANGAHLDLIVLDHRRSHIEVRDFDGRLMMLSLFLGSIRIEEARATAALVRVLPRTVDNPNWKPRFLRAPLTMEVRRLVVGSGTLVSTSGRAFDATDITGSGIVRPYTLRIYDSSMQYSGLTVRADGEVRAARPFGLAGSVHFAMSPPDQPAWAANASIDGDLDEIAITGAITEPLSASFVGTANSLTSDWQWQGQSQLKRLDLTAWDAGDALGIITGTLQLAGDRNGFRAQGPLTPPGLKAGALQLEFAGSYAERVLTADRLQFLHQPSGTRLSAAGTIGIVADGPQLNLRGSWSTLRWPLADADAPVHSDSGQYTLSGMWPYALQASGELRAQQWPTMQFRGSGLLARDRLTVQQSTVSAFDGQAELTGSAEWAPAERWQTRGMVRGIDVAAVRPGIDGRLNFLLEASGEGFGEQGTLEARVSSISGTIRGQRASGRAAVALDGEDWLLSDVRLQLGATRINVDGRFGAQLDARFDVDAADLALLQSAARGRLAARGTVRGDLKNPVLDVTARGSDIRWGDVALETIQATIALDPVSTGRADALVAITGLHIADRVIDTLEFSSEGTTAAHHAKLSVAAPQLKLNAAGDASLANGIWRWRLAQLRAEDGRELQLALESPTLLELGADHIRIGQLCLRGEQARLCGSGSNLAGQRALTVTAQDLPMRALTAAVAADTSFDGTLTINGSAAAAPGAPWTGSMRAVLDKAAVRHRFASGRVESFDLGTGNITADMTAAGLDGRVALDAGAAGRMNGWISARGTSGAWDEWPISGALQFESDALDVLDSYITQIDRASGRLQANLRLNGTLRAPQFDGDLTVSDAQVDAYQINLALRDINFAARLSDNRLSFDGRATAGVDGKAQFDGELAWRQGLPYGKLHLQGTDLRIVNIPEARVQVSPDVNLTVNGRRIDITGTIELPYARLEQPDQLANAVRISGDEVIVSAEQSAPDDPFHVYSNVTLKLGDRVTISTSGLSGRLSGAITASNDESGFSRGSGELSIEEGKYTAYGRKLDIVRGRLIFSNSPLGDPGVDLRAAKRFPDVAAGNVTVGVNVRGTLTAPRMTFYSEPAIAQSQIVSLLLAGSMDRLQTAGATGQSNSARNEAITQGSAILAQQFGSKLGIDDISVESTSLQNDTSLVLGRYLSPRLYLSYGVSFAEALTTFKLNYTIGDKWTLRLETESGNANRGRTNGADLVYTLER